MCLKHVLQITQSICVDQMQWSYFEVFVQEVGAPPNIFQLLEIYSEDAV